MSKKITLLFLILVLLSSVIGIHVIQLYKVHKSKIDFIENNPNIKVQFEVNKIDFSKFVWLKKNKEFKYKGNLYDITKIIETKNGKKFFCINDSYEKKIEQLFYKLYKEKKENKKKLNTNGYYLPILITNQDIITFKRKKTKIKSLISQLSTIYLDIPYSPPKNNLLS